MMGSFQGLETYGWWSLLTRHAARVRRAARRVDLVCKAVGVVNCGRAWGPRTSDRPTRGGAPRALFGDEASPLRVHGKPPLPRWLTSLPCRNHEHKVIVHRGEG